jgi:hypothetical protein
VKVESGRWGRRGRRVGLASAAGGRSRVGAENSVTAFETSRRLVTSGAGKVGGERACKSSLENAPPRWLRRAHVRELVRE